MIRKRGIQEVKKYPTPPKNILINNGSALKIPAVVTAPKVLLQCADAHIVIAHNRSSARKIMPSMTEMIRDGKDGALVEVKNTKALRNAVNNLIESKKYKALGHNAQKRQRERFSIERFIENFEKVYE